MKHQVRDHEYREYTVTMDEDDLLEVAAGHAINKLTQAEGIPEGAITCHRAYTTSYENNGPKTRVNLVLRAPLKVIQGSLLEVEHD